MTLTFKVLVHAVSGIGGNHGKTGAAVKIFAHHITFINRHPMLATDQTYQPGTAPVTTFPGQSQTGFEGRHLRKGFTIFRVPAPGIGQTGVGFPVVGQLIADTGFASHDGGVDVIDLADICITGIVAEKDKIIYATDISRNPGVCTFAGILCANIKLGRFFGFHFIKRV